MSIIKNYGFLWERKYINRGAGGYGNAGNLIGYRTGAATKLVDFREQIGVYALYDQNLTIVYIGQAGNGNATLFSRLKQHMTSNALRNRWSYFSWVGFRQVNSRTSDLSIRQENVSSRVSGFTYGDALNEIEGILIEFIEPKLNKQGGKLKKAREYLQKIPDEDEFATLDSLSSQVANLEVLLKIKS
jgi:hypothetical protein